MSLKPVLSSLHSRHLLITARPRKEQKQGNTFKYYESDSETEHRCPSTMSAGRKLPPGMDRSVYQPDGDPEYDDSQAEEMIERSRGNVSSKLLDIFKNRPKRKRVESVYDARQAASKRSKPAPTPPSESVPAAKAPARKQQKQPIPARRYYDNDLDKLSAALESRAAGYTKLIDHTMKDMGKEAIEQIEATVVAEVTESAQQFAATLDTLKGNQRQGEQGITQNQVLIGTFLKDLDSWEALETRKLQLRKKIMAERVLAMLDQNQDELEGQRD